MLLCYGSFLFFFFYFPLCYLCCRNQEMDKKECANVLVNRVRKVEPSMAVDIVDHFVSTNELPRVRLYSSGSDEQIHSLIAETKKRMNVMSKAHSPGREFPALSRTSDGIQSPTPGGDHIVSSKIEAHSTPPAGQIVSSQIEENLRSSSVPGDGMPGCSNVTGCPASRSEQLANIPCRFYMSTGVCKKGWSCRFSHGFGPLGMLEMAIRELLMNRPLTRVADLPVYLACYKQPLQGWWNQSTGSIISLLARLHTVTLIVDRMGQNFIVLLEHAPSYLGPAVNLNVMDTGSGFNKIYITFTAEGRARCTESLVSNYFSQYGPVLKVRMPTPRLCGFVTFQYPQTVELLLFEWNPQVPHFICGATVLVKPYKHSGETKPGNINIAERNGLQRGCDVGIVTGNSSVMIAPQMVPPLAQNPGSQAEREVNTPEGGDVTRPAHMSDGSDGHLARQDMNTNVTEKNELHSWCDVGIATENSNVTIAPQMAPPIAQNPGSNSEIEVKTPEGGDVTRPAHMSDGPDGQSTRRDMDDDIYHVSYSSLPGIDCFYEQPEPSAEQAQVLEQQFPADAIDE
ncbi:hypothetical protein BRADI_1g23370v3 [Brachypodium distachyon]|uniref:C3H1-type domain-containing protein n=1 Tax=Brachypodium distachyon TaxID=15368 RepID=A0A0Q3KWF9_BRADI|nr:hypothetical protein BRADI_1g23370v3 [Brachypodium distachyon]